MNHNSLGFIDKSLDAYSRKRQELVQPIRDYLANTSLSKRGESNDVGSDLLGDMSLPFSKSCSLILDGTGPRLTAQLPYLNAMGPDTLLSFDHVFAFSGGIGAYCAYLAQTHGYLNHELSHYFTSIDRQARLAHRLSFPAFLGLLNKFISKKPLYSRLCYMDLFRHIVSQDFMRLPLDQIAPNFIPYVALPKRLRPLAVTAENGFDRAAITMAEVMAAGMKIPHIYGAGTRVRRSSLANAYDATYTSGYWSVRSRLIESHEVTVILTMSPDGLPEHVCGVDVLRGKNPHYQFTYDIFSLLFNIPNKRYQRDLELAYL